MSISLQTCYDCMNTFEEDMSPKCPVCELKKEMQEKIDELHELIRNFHSLE